MSNLSDKILVYVKLAVITFVIGITLISVIKRNLENIEIRKQSICPPLLSIGRSPRDTLIVMKAEPFCNDFVLENLK